MEKKITVWERFLSKEIGIEFKACLYFFCFLFFYSVYKMVQGSFEASILHMTEMILATYAMGYVQVYLLNNFDEGEHLGIRECVYTIGCGFVYAVIAHMGNWFAGNVIAVICFFLYVELAYVCAYLVYKVKRNIDTKLLNMDLIEFQRRGERCENEREGN